MLDELYNREILTLAGNLSRLGRLPAPHATSRQHSKLCGSTVIVDLTLSAGRVADYAHDVKACALGQASAAIVAQHVIGATPAELRDLRDQMRAMLKTNGAPPSGHWSAAAVLEPVRDFRARHASTLLAFEAAAEAASMAEQAERVDVAN